MRNTFRARDHLRRGEIDQSPVLKFSDDGSLPKGGCVERKLRLQNRILVYLVCTRGWAFKWSVKLRDRWLANYMIKLNTEKSFSDLLW